MAEENFVVGLVVERVAPSSPWAEASWRPGQVFPVVPATPPWTRLGGTAEVEQFYVGPVTVTFHGTETANYQTNLAAGPKLWVVLRPTGAEPAVEVVTVTADPAEGEAFTEPGFDVVETVPMPPELAAELARFVATHHVDRPFFKRRRDSKEMDRIGGKTEGER